MLEEAVRSLAHRAGPEHERHREQSHIGKPAERGETIDSQQHDQKKCQPENHAYQS
jgi:hypothetical protein